MSRRTIGVMLVVGSVLALSATPALAAKKNSAPGKVKTVVATTSTSANGQFVTATAACPKGTKVVGGGYLTQIATSGGSLSDVEIVTESRRDGPKAWTVSAYRIDGSAAGPTLPMNAEAYCRSGAGKISEVSNTAGRGPSLTPWGVDAACARGKAITAGGFSFAVANFTSFHYFHNTSRPIGNVGWSVEATATALAANSATSIAYCQKRSKPLAQRSSQIALTPGSGVISSADSPACPGKRSATAGGFEGPNLLSGIGSPVVVESRRAEKSWHVGAINVNFASSGFITAIGVCS